MLNKKFWREKKIRIRANKGLRLQLLCVCPFRWKAKAKVDFTSMEERVKKEKECVSVWVCECVWERGGERETINVKSFGDKLRRMGCVWKEAVALLLWEFILCTGKYMVIAEKEKESEQFLNPRFFSGKKITSLVFYECYFLRENQTSRWLRRLQMETIILVLRCALRF